MKVKPRHREMLDIYMVLCTNMIHVFKINVIDGRSRVFVGVKQSTQCRK